MYNKKVEKIFICLFFVIILIPLFSTNIKKDAISEIENRKLFELEISSFDNLSINVENYLKDRIGLRRQMIFAFQEIYDLLFHEYAGAQTYGKNNYTFIQTNGEIDDWQRNNIDYDYVDSMSRYIRSIQEVCENQNIDFMFFIPTSKEEIYGEYFPSTINQSNTEISRMDAMLMALEEYDVKFVYTKDFFLSLKDSEQLYAVKYDPAHWNSNGAFEGVRLLLDKMKEAFPELGIEGLRKEKFDVWDAKVEKQLHSDWIINDTIPVYELVDKNLYKQSKYTDLKYSTYYSRYINPYNKEGKSLLVFHDSYLMGREQLFFDNFSEIVFLHIDNINDIEYYLNIFSPDAVVFERVQWALLHSAIVEPKECIPYTNTINESMLTSIALVDGLTKIAILDSNPLTVIKGKAAFMDENIAYKMYATAGNKHYIVMYDIKSGEFVVSIPTIQLMEADSIAFQLINDKGEFSCKELIEVDWIYNKEKFFDEYKQHISIIPISGIFDDGWCEPEAHIIMETNEASNLHLLFYYPGEAVENAIASVDINGNSYNIPFTGTYLERYIDISMYENLDIGLKFNFTTTERNGRPLSCVVQLNIVE